MERKIGEIFEVNGKWYQCVEGNCAYCSLKDEACEQRIINDVCKLNRIFKKLEKVGEPFYRRWTLEGNNKLMQRYKIYTTPLITIDKQKMFYNLTDDLLEIEIKQNKEDMEEKKDNYDGNMDKECIPICDALNSIPGVHTTESCCGHCKDRFMIFLTCDNPHSLAIIARVFDRRYISTSQPWYIELQTKDSGAYDYFIHSETKYDSEEVMMKDVNQIIENIGYWCDDKFASHFKGCDNKPTLAPFDINLAKAGNPVCTRDGRKARIICFDRENEQPIVALIKDNEDEREYIDTFFNNGHSVSKTNEVAGDLMMLPEKKEGWVNVDKRSNGGVIISKPYPTRDEAIHNSTELTIDTVKIKWDEIL